MVYLCNGILFNHKKSQILLTSGKEPTCQCRRCKSRGFNPRIGKIPWRRAWQPTPVFLLEKSNRQRKLSGYHTWDHKELDTTEPAHTHTHTHTTQAVITEVAGIWQESHSRGFLAPNILSSVLCINLLLLQQQNLYRMFPPRPMPPPLPVPPKTLLLFSLFSFLNNTISVLVQSFKKLGLELVFKSFWLLLFPAVYFPKGSDHSLEHLAYSVEL